MQFLSQQLQREKWKKIPLKQFIIFSAICATVRTQNANSTFRHIRLSPAFVCWQYGATWDGDMYKQRTGSVPSCVIWFFWGPKGKNNDQRKCQDSQSRGTCYLLLFREVSADTPLLPGAWMEEEGIRFVWWKFIPFLLLPIKHASKKKNVSFVLRKFNYKGPANKL